MALGAGGYAFLFSFGSAVFFNVSKDQQVELLRSLRAVLTGRTRGRLRSSPCC